MHKEHIVRSFREDSTIKKTVVILFTFALVAVAGVSIGIGFLPY